MGKTADVMLDEIGGIIRGGLDEDGTLRILRILDGPAYPKEFLEEMTLYSEMLPLGREHPFTPEQRCLHFLWDAFDRLPVCLDANFGILFRRMVAERLFKKCGAGFIAEENCRFNFGRNIEVGDFVFFNRGVFVDSKGGVTIGSHVALTEDVRIFTHSHSEASHIVREYKPVVIRDYAKIYSGAVILPGVTVGEQAIVASHSMVVRDVPANALVAGIPAQVVRMRKTEGREGEELDHLWLF
jgi:acetyltransferase-like isoleucine patch superfamily enzyme